MRMSQAHLIWTALFISLFPRTAGAQFRPPRAEQGPHVLYYEAFPLPLAGDSLRQRIDIHYRIDREFFVPVRDPEDHAAFHRSGEIIAELVDSVGGIAARSMRSLEIPEEDADRKPAGTEWEEGIFSLQAPPGRYRIQVTAEDEESRRSITEGNTFVRTPGSASSGLSTAYAVPVAPPREAGVMPGEL
ncbi:MAG TPA: hypothetical protein VK569_03920, partial [Bacteroidota bacterium]|nr:hypothetical protein [Bacteroidota bacterium]